jgi:hypothetical protein
MLDGTRILGTKTQTHLACRRWIQHSHRTILSYWTYWNFSCLQMSLGEAPGVAPEAPKYARGINPIALRIFKPQTGYLRRYLTRHGNRLCTRKKHSRMINVNSDSAVRIMHVSSTVQHCYCIVSCTASTYCVTNHHNCKLKA